MKISKECIMYECNFNNKKPKIKRSNFPSLKHPRYNHSAIILRDYLFILFGEDTMEDVEYINLADIDNEKHKF